MGLTVAGVPISSTPAAPIGIVSTVTGVGLSAYGFATVGDAAVDSYHALIDDYDYFERDSGGVIANIGGIYGGKKGALIGSSTELGLDLATMRSPSVGVSRFSDYTLSIAGWTGNAFSALQVYDNLQYLYTPAYFTPALSDEADRARGRSRSGGGYSGGNGDSDESYDGGYSGGNPGGGSCGCGCDISCLPD